MSEKYKISSRTLYSFINEGNYSSLDSKEKTHGMNLSILNYA